MNIPIIIAVNWLRLRLIIMVSSSFFLLGHGVEVLVDHHGILVLGVLR